MYNFSIIERKIKPVEQRGAMNIFIRINNDEIQSRHPENAKYIIGDTITLGNCFYVKKYNITS